MLQRLLGSFLGPADDPKRYQLKELISRTSSPDRPVEVWKARRDRDDLLIEVKIITADPDHNYCSLSLLEGEGWILWVIAGYWAGQPCTDKCSLPPPDVPSRHAGRVHCVAILDSFLFPPPFEGEIRLLPSYHQAAFTTWSAEEDLHVKLTDFSEALDSRHSADSIYHEPSDWADPAPEQLLLDLAHRFGRAEKGDIWQVGVLICHLLFDKNLTTIDLDLSYQRFGAESGPLERWNVKPEVIISLASLNPDQGWPSFFDTAGNPHPEFSGYSDFPFYLDGIKPHPSIRDRILAESASSSLSPSDVELLSSFLKACWTLNPYKRPSAGELLEHEFLGGIGQQKEQ
ncbi:hypothetical protein JCM11251_003641 [Rhodosporidiobolus azoricus]